MEKTATSQTVIRRVPCACNSMKPTEAESKAAFEAVGMEVAAYERVFVFMARVLTTCGGIYTYDGSHGGGQYFSRDA